MIGIDFFRLPSVNSKNYKNLSILNFWTGRDARRYVLGVLGFVSLSLVEIGCDALSHVTLSYVEQIVLLQNKRSWRNLSVLIFLYWQQSFFVNVIRNTN